MKIDNNKTEIARRITEFFNKTGFSNQILAEILKTKIYNISKLKSGVLSPKSFIVELSNLGLNIEYLYTGKGDLLNKVLENKNDYTLKKLCEINDENQYKLFKDISGFNEDLEKAIQSTLLTNPDEEIQESIDYVNNFEEYLKEKNVTFSLYSLVYNKGINEEIYNKHLRNKILFCFNSATYIDLMYNSKYAIRLRDKKIGVITYLNEIGKLPTKIDSFQSDLNNLNKVENEVLNLSEFDFICGSMNRRIEF